MNNISGDNDEQRDNTTSAWSEELSYTDYAEYQVAVIIWKTFPPCLLLLGSFGNVATICIMRRIKDHNSSQHAFLTALAVSDLTVLGAAIPRYWIMYIWRVDIVNLHAAICKIRNFLVYDSSLTSAWLVTCVTVQRTMAVLWPHRMRVMCTVRRTWIVIAALVLSLCALNSHFLIGLDVSEKEGCHARKGAYLQFYEYFWSMLDLFLASFLPAACLIVCDVILSVSLFKAVSSSSSSIATRAESNAKAAHGTDSRRRASYKTTVMILAISCAFLVFTLPLYVRIVLITHAHFVVDESPRTRAVDALLQAAVFQLWSANSAVNFVLYCLTGTKFRRAFLRWIRCCCDGGAQSLPAPSVHVTASEASKEGRR